MKFRIYIAAFLLITQGISAQNSIDSVLSLIEKNNTTLIAARKTTDAEKTANRIGLFLPNPEADFAFLKADGAQPVKRTDFSISQSFDFPTAYGFRSSISKLKSEQSELSYESNRREVLLKARLICSELIYRNALQHELERRLKHAGELASAYSKMLEAGEANILEYNRAQLNYATLNSELSVNETERNSLLLELASLNGGFPINFIASAFQPVIMNYQFDEFYKTMQSNNTGIQWMSKETEITIRERKLNTALSLPRLSAGYLSENVPGEAFKGVTAGISIPLWENRNTVKYAKARTSALKSLQEDQELQFKNTLKDQFERTSQLSSAVNLYRENMTEYNSELLLTKALNSGQISLTEYFFELGEYYNAIDRLLEMERDLNIAYSELIQVR